MDYLGYIALIGMGTVLGLIGGGGSILTVPILVYLLKIDAVDATAYSLFIVGAAAAFGAFNYIKLNQVDFRVGAFFALPSFLGVYLVRRYGMPMIPETISIFEFSILKDSLVLVVFSALMLLASISMIKGRKEGAKKAKELNHSLIVFEGLIIGAITGFVGAGGGFIIIPALVVLAGLEMKVAVGTSLLIIAVKSLFGFTGDLQVMDYIDWNLLGLSLALSVMGIYIGIYLSKKIPGSKLKPVFGWFVLIVGSAMMIQQLFF